MFYVYIIFSASANVNYVGHTEDYQRRLHEHNTDQHNHYTSHRKPWVLSALFQTTDRSSAMLAEKFIKRQKSSAFLQQLIVSKNDLTGILSCLKKVSI